MPVSNRIPEIIIFIKRIRNQLWNTPKTFEKNIANQEITKLSPKSKINSHPQIDEYVMHGST